MRRAVRLLAVALLSCAPLHAQERPAWGRTLVVIPFESASLAPGLDWLGEGFAEALRSQLDSPVLYVATREERLRAYDRQGIPAAVHASRATLYRLAEQMDVDYALLGSYRSDGESVTATVQLLDMRAPRLLPGATETARLSDLGKLQSALAWDVLRSIRTDFAVPKDKYIAGAPAISAEVMENYIHGVLAGTTSEKVRQFREAARLDPAFAEAWLELGKAYYEQRSYEASMSSLEKIPSSSSVAREANFYLGLSACAHGDFEVAEKAFEFIASRLPLAEVYNNLGVVAEHRGQKKAISDFERAVQNDPSDPDYHFNLGLALSRSGEPARATRELRIALEQRPDDAEARVALDSLAPPAAGAIVNSAAVAKLPPERLKRNYQENAFRQMTMQIQSWAEQQFARSDPRTHARYHLELGKELLAHGFMAEAEGEFRHAATVDPASPAPLAALAEVYDARGDAREARAQAEASLRVHESVEAYLVLTRLDLREGRTDSAEQNISRALQLEPANPAAQDLKRTLAAKLTEKGQP
ncbi:MAG: tetratricopeptide repeat protein [Terriglobales bacterium]